MKRALLLFLLLSHVCLAKAIDHHALVLMPTQHAGPRLDPKAEVQAEWVLWPAKGESDGSNGLLSLVTGVDWRGEADDFVYQPSPDGNGYLAANAVDLRSRGFFAARARLRGMRPVVTVLDPNGLASTGALLLGYAGGERVQIAPFTGPWPRGALLVHEARNWDDIDALAKRAGGRVLVIENPPTGSDRWSRMWFFGKGWPSGIPHEAGLRVPGLIHARDALRLLQTPDRFAWVPNDAGHWGGANRWFDQVRFAGFAIELMAALLLVYVCGCAVFLIINERPGAFAAHLIAAVLLTIPAATLSGNLARVLGTDTLLSTFVFVFVGLVMASLVLRSLLERKQPDVHPLLATCLIGVAAMVLSDPRWSVLSQTFNDPVRGIPPEATGALFGFFALGAAHLRTSWPRSEWPIRFVAAGLLLWGVTGAWWRGPDLALLTLPVVAWLAAEGWFRAPMLLFLALIPAPEASLRHGFVWLPYDLIERLDQRDAINLWRHFDFLRSPSVLAFAAVAGLFALLRESYLARKLRDHALRDPANRSLAWTAAAAFALSLLHPDLLHAAATLTIALFAVAVHDAVRPRRSAPDPEGMLADLPWTTSRWTGPN